MQIIKQFLMENRNRLLCVLDGMCHPPRTGGDQAVFNALKIIQNHVQLHIIIVRGDKTNINIELLKEDLNNAEILFYDISHKNKYELINAVFNKARIFFLRLIRQNKNVVNREGLLSVSFNRNADLYDFLNAYIINNKIQIVQFEFARALYWAQAIYAPVKKIFVQHEIQYVVKKQRFHQRDVSSLEKIRYQIERNRELEAMNIYDAIITLSDDDKNRLLKDGVRAKIYSSFAKVQYRKKYSCNYSNAKNIDIVFVGPESHEPNRQGLSWFMSNVWNKVLCKFNNTAIHIVGKWSDKTQKEWKSKYSNIIFEGFVDDLSVILRDNILIVPIFEGSGIRMKILEAANVGTPFVSTTIGAEGLGFESGKNCMIANNENEFYNAIQFLLSSKDELDRLSKKAYEHAIDDFSDKRFVETRMKAYNGVLN